jgi:hypothetical protein
VHCANLLEPAVEHSNAIDVGLVSGLERMSTVDVAGTVAEAEEA